MLSTDDLTSLRTQQSANLPDTATIRRATRASDSAGGWNVTWATHETDVPCRVVQPSTPIPLTNALQETVYANWIVTLAYDADVIEEDEMVVDGRTLTVLSTVRGPWQTALRVICSERI